MNTSSNIIVGISIGDINGIGIEVILKTFADKRMLEFCTPVLFGSAKTVSFHKKTLDIQTHIHGINTIDKVVHGKINLLNVWNEELKIDLGTASKELGNYAFKSLDKAVEALKNNKIDLLLTAPINKDTIQSDDFSFPGHTEYLQSHLEGKSLMILLNEELRVGLLTGHIPVSDVASTITPELIEDKVAIMYTSLVEDFGISKPKIAVLGLNPHSGDNGLIGKEEKEIIAPTIKKIRDTGKLVFGPYAADGFFGSKTYEQFDGVLAMYHDQGLAPFKALSFGAGVNFTAGLSKIRTSPDHGTGFDIAGKGIANSDSFKEALFTALKIHKNRAAHIEITKNVLKTK
ncbi:4-hydroxythreonine-4-phosphate dehydrogenase PdxA [Flavobacteriaceae bacterium S356]|uniref:4-hydroxythreonine-4-phosphate dehydrogenase PdxA n=1 Tax=Asprobacillus argus TaxID=3076534 RepID=A0ABU3LG72_9FLAO|nr:4-hydroxythreonine-4-phosphate dehydrogenase PdxA [Flavobacteriaceae bacterium S356]